MTTEEKQKEPFEGDAKKIYEIVRGEKAFVATLSQKVCKLKKLLL